MLSVLLVLRTQEGIDEQVGSARGDRGGGEDGGKQNGKSSSDQC